MSFTIEIPDSLFQRLQKHAIPLVDTPLSVIERWADHFEATMGQARFLDSEGASVGQQPRKFDALQPPELSHTRAKGSFGPMAFSNWNDLVRVAHAVAMARLKSFDDLRTITHAQIREGNYSENGYHYVSDIGISIQGVDARHAWMYSLRLAKQLNVPIKVLIEWRDNAKAAYPGQSGILEWNPS